MSDLQRIAALIAVHKATWIALGEACDRTDHAVGAKALHATEQAQSKASDATFEALWNIIEHPYTSLPELKRGVAYLAEHHTTTGDGDPGEWFVEIAARIAALPEGGSNV